MSNYLIEIGTEELPYKFVSSAIDQLKNLISEKLADNRITFENIKVYGTPRRLAVIVENISEFQPDLSKEVKGPPANVAFNADGDLTPAGIGFAKKQGVEPSKLVRKPSGETEYVFAEIHEKGQHVSNVLQNIIPDLILKLQGSHFMRWENLEIKFSRPIRWIVSLLDNKEVKVKIGNIESGKHSRGHRFSPEKSVEINSPDTYVDDLYKAQVIVDQSARKEEIIAYVNKKAENIYGKAVIDESLLEEVTFIVEWPTPVLGTFDAKYLTVPQEVITTVMASHQRYFPVFSKDGEKLLNYFITMSNYNLDNFENIKAGNERVIKARLDDAMFFFKEDTKKTLFSRIKDLKGVTFQKDLGTIYDKVNRIKEISSFIAKKRGLDSSTQKLVEKASLLSKADLVTSLVREFTELQGVIGSKYAAIDNEDERVCKAIREHYLPVVSDGELAESIIGQILGIADKIDTICGVFAIGKSPTGSADPLGVRRAAIGIILTILNKGINLDLSSIIKTAISTLPLKLEQPEEIENNIREFIIQRLRIHLNEKYRYDLVEAVLSSNDPLFDLKDVITRLDILSELVNSQNYNRFHESAIRINKIIKSELVSTIPDSSLFVQDIEDQLWNCANSIDENKVNYNELVEKLENCIPVIESFFEQVLVMDNNLNIRENRLSLLGNYRKKFLKLADFSKIVSQ